MAAPWYWAGKSYDQITQLNLPNPMYSTQLENAGVSHNVAARL